MSEGPRLAARLYHFREQQLMQVKPIVYTITCIANCERPHENEILRSGAMIRASTRPSLERWSSGIVNHQREYITCHRARLKEHVSSQALVLTIDPGQTTVHRKY